MFTAKISSQLLLNRTALITGAASGIGKAMSTRLLGSGVATLLAVDISEVNLHQACEAFQLSYPSATIVPIICDVTDGEALAVAFKTMVGKAPPLSIVVNNAGTAVENVNWKHNVELNLVAAITGTQLGLESFANEPAAEGGVVVNVASMAGLFPMAFGPIYSAAKHGLVGYSRCFDHLARKNIRVNCLCPAFVDTPLVREMLENGPPKIANSGKLAIDSLGGLIPMKQVEDAFIDLAANEEHVGSVLRVTNAGGAALHRFPSS